MARPGDERVWTGTARAQKGSAPGREGRRDGRTCINGAAKQLKDFLYPTTEKVTFRILNFHYCVLTEPLKSQCFPLPGFSCPGAFVFLFCSLCPFARAPGAVKPAALEGGTWGDLSGSDSAGAAAGIGHCGVLGPLLWNRDSWVVIPA